MTVALSRAGRRPGTGPSALLERLARRAFFDRLAALRQGHIEVEEEGAIRSFGEDSESFDLRARILVRDPGFYSQVAFGGSLGTAESYIDGLWDTDDLTTLVRIMARNRQLGRGLDGGAARLVEPLHRLWHWQRRNTRRGSRRNIAEHYDLGNDFFALFLDPTLTYSCAVFPCAEATLEEASTFKNDLICRKLELGPADEVLEIGTGWGGFALHAASRYGCRVTTTTISENQYRLAGERVRQAGLEDRITLLLEDYRDLPALLPRRFDKLVSIEMIEAVGERYLDLFFSTSSGLLRADGMMLLQAIVIADQSYDAYRRSVDFIQRYIFPGGFLPSVGVMTDSIARQTDLRLFDLQDITPHYARTLRHWRHNFERNAERLADLGFSERFARLWKFYFCYCEGGFLERVIGDVQLLLTKPLNRRPSLLPEI